MEAETGSVRTGPCSGKEEENQVQEIKKRLKRRSSVGELDQRLGLSCT